MGLFSKLLKGPQPDMEKSAANEKKVRALFDQVVENGEKYRLIVGYTEDAITALSTGAKLKSAI